MQKLAQLRSTRKDITRILHLLPPSNERNLASDVTIQNNIIRATHKYARQLYKKPVTTDTLACSPINHPSPSITLNIRHLTLFFFVALRPPAGHVIPIPKVSRSHTTTHHSR